jgi:hypothetical protein
MGDVLLVPSYRMIGAQALRSLTTHCRRQAA